MAEKMVASKVGKMVDSKVHLRDLHWEYLMADKLVG